MISGGSIATPGYHCIESQSGMPSEHEVAGSPKDVGVGKGYGLNDLSRISSNSVPFWRSIQEVSEGSQKDVKAIFCGFFGVGLSSASHTQHTHTLHTHHIQMHTPTHIHTHM